MTPSEIHELKEHWKAFEKARVEGGVANIPTVALTNLAKKMSEAALLLAIFPEAETTRYWLCLKAAEINTIINHRKVEYKI